MGTNCAPLVAALFLFSYERDFMKSLSRENQADIIEALWFILRGDLLYVFQGIILFWVFQSF